MSDYIDIAASLHTNSLTLFVGTGFTKYMSNNKAPNWLELLVECTKKIDRKDVLINQLFNSDDSGNVTQAKFELSICAQILESEYIKKRKDIKVSIAEIISKKVNEKTIDKVKLSKIQSFFSEYPNINIITTNYDTLFSEFIIPLTSRIIIEGSTIPRLNSGQNIYHIHGSINKPSSIVLTINDYYNFQNTNNYFSRKFFTLLQESTVAILGYSLGDFNLNSILNEVKNTRCESFRKTDIYYVTKDNVPDVLERFYSTSYGIKVLKDTNVEDFFDEIEKKFPKAKELIESVEDLKDVIAEKIEYTDDFLKLRMSLSSILVQAASIGIESNDIAFIKTLFILLERKRLFTREDGAWVQYEHLADWLIEIASIISIKGTAYENNFLDITTYSFKKSSRAQYKGFSWHAWQEWHSRWHEMKIENQIFLEEFIENSKWDEDLEITEIYK